MLCKVERMIAEGGKKEHMYKEYRGLRGWGLLCKAGMMIDKEGKGKEIVCTGNVAEYCTRQGLGLQKRRRREKRGCRGREPLTDWYDIGKVKK